MQPWEYNDRTSAGHRRRRIGKFIGQIIEAGFMVGGIYTIVLVKTLKTEIKYQIQKRNNSTSFHGE